jgi:nucleotide-binding universal stress UspA family protein
MRIVVPIDGSAASHRALTHALAILAGHKDASLILLNVQSAETLDVSDVSAVMSAAHDRKLAARRSARALREPLAMCRAAGTHYEIRAELGPVAETIDRLARELKADQIVMGTRGHGAIGRLLLGSVAGKVVELASVPVTLVK